MRKYDTCFFERYAQISLEALLGSEFAGLLNEDRPDLQSPDGRTLGIEVTRAMEESKEAANSLLKGMAGMKAAGTVDDDLYQIIENGYGFGLEGGRYIGVKELDYWSMALPLKRILKSKIEKVANGFYGHFDKMGLYVFCKDPLSAGEIYKTCRYAMDLQKYNTLVYDRLYLAEAGSLHVCNLEYRFDMSSRISSVQISQQQRREFYLEALHQQLETDQQSKKL